MNDHVADPLRTILNVFVAAERKATLPRRAKEIQRMPYGSPMQIEAADAYLERFMWLYQRGNPAVGRCSWLMDALDSAWGKLILTDVFYLAKQRWNERQLEAIAKTVMQINRQILQ